MTSPEPDPYKRGLRRWLAWIFLPLLVGLGLAALVPRPIVGLIYLQEAIHAFSSRDMIAQIHFARDHPEVRAVVLVLDSPGGTVVDTEAVYLELAGLRERKPVVTMAQGLAASGAYYLSVGTDYIFAGPSSLVGNVGVISQLPTAPSAAAKPWQSVRNGSCAARFGSAARPPGSAWSMSSDQFRPRSRKRPSSVTLPTIGWPICAN